MDDIYWRGVYRDWKVLCDLGFFFFEVGIFLKLGISLEEILGKICFLFIIMRRIKLDKN